MVPFALIASAALALQTADTVLPRFAPSVVRIKGDTVWWVPQPGKRVGPIPVAGYVVSTGRFFGGRRSLTAVRETPSAIPASGSLAYQTYVGDSLQLPWGYSLRDTTSQPDPRPKLDGESEVRSTPRFALAFPGRPNAELRIRITGAERRRLYLASGGTLKPKAIVPPFTTAISRWTARNGVLVFAFDAPSPPEQDYGHGYNSEIVEHPDDGTSGPDYLGGILIADSASGRLRPILHHRLVTKQFGGLEIAGGALWTSVTEWAAPEEGKADSVVLARYDLDRRTWRLYKQADIALANPSLHRGDGERLYFIGTDGIAVLNARTSQWQIRYFHDSTYVLPSGLDTAITVMSVAKAPARRPPPSEYDADNTDTTGILEQVADELEIESHRTAFMAMMRRYLPVREVGEARPWGPNNMYQCDYGCPFVGILTDLDMNKVLARREYLPALLEAAERSGTHAFAVNTMKELGPGFVLDAFRHAMTRGEMHVAIEAADSLHQRKDSSGVRWLRQRLHDPQWLEIRAGEMDHPYYETPIQTVIRQLSRMGDTAFVARALDLIASGRMPAEPGYQMQMFDALVAHPDTTVRTRLVKRLEAEPRLWPWLMVIAPDSQSKGPWIEAARGRIAQRLINSSRSFTDSIVSGADPESRRWLSRAFLIQRAIEYMTQKDPAVVVPAFIETFDLDPEWAYMKHSYLVTHTGNDTAPASPDYGATSAQVAEATNFWRTWWKANAATFRPADEAAGKAAWDRWSKRRYPQIYGKP